MTGAPSEQVLRELLELSGSATAGEWEAVLIDDPRGQPVPYYRGLICTVEHGSRYLSVVAKSDYVPREEWEANARLIAAARNALPAIAQALLDAGEELEKMRRALRQIMVLPSCATVIAAEALTAKPSGAVSDSLTSEEKG